MSSAYTSDEAGFQMETMSRTESYLFRITDKMLDVAPFIGVYLVGLTFDILWIKYFVLLVGLLSQPFVIFILLRLLQYTLKVLYVILIKLLLVKLGTFTLHLLLKLIPKRISAFEISMPSQEDHPSWIYDPLPTVTHSCYSEVQVLTHPMVYNSWRETTRRDEVEHQYHLEEGEYPHSGNDGSDVSEEDDCPDLETYQEAFQPKHELEREMQYNGPTRERSRSQHISERTKTTSSAGNSADEYPKRHKKYGKQVSHNEGSKPSHSKQKRHSLPHSASVLPSKHNMRHSTHTGPYSTAAKLPSYMQPTQSTLSQVKTSHVKPAHKRDDSPKRVSRMPSECREIQNDSKRRKSMNYHVPVIRDASSSPKIRRALSKSQESLSRSVTSTRDIPLRPDSLRLESPRQESPRQESPRQESPRQESSRQESFRQESPRQESPKQESLRQELLRQESPRQESLVQESPKPRKRYSTCSEIPDAILEHPFKELSPLPLRKSTGSLIDANTFQQLTDPATPNDSVMENMDKSLSDIEQPEMSEEEAMFIISDGHESFMKTITCRKPNVDRVHDQYAKGNIKRALEIAKNYGDEAVFVNLFSAVIKQSDLLSLDLALSILPTVKDLINTEHEYFVSTACDMLRLLLVKFKEVIQGNIHPRSSIGVDIAREDRAAKSVRFYKMVTEIDDLLGDSHCLCHSMSKSFKELKLLISMLD